MVAGVCVPDGDYDELLREAVRIALRWDRDGDFPFDAIDEQIDAYIASPEGEGKSARTLMRRLVACISDVIPLAP
jgi:hypothetical protein